LQKRKYDRNFTLIQKHHTIIETVLKIFQNGVNIRQPGSSVSIASYGLDDREKVVRSPAEAKGLFF
jgi:hypothetical protein